jgi:hypothetical protein
MSEMSYPSRKQLATLTKRGWRKCHGGLFWQSPYDKIFYSPRKAVIVEVRRGRQEAPIHSPILFT